MDDLNDLKAQIFYCLREKYYNSMLNLCKENLTKSQDMSINLLYSLSLILNDRTEEAINELEIIKSENDTKLAAIIALIYANKLLRINDKELYLKLDNELRDLRKTTTNPIDFYHAGIVLFIFEKYDKAIDYLEKAASLNSDFMDAQLLKGWVLLFLKKYNLRNVQNIAGLFETVLTNNRRNLDASLGLTESYLYQNNYNEAIATINKAIVRFPGTKLPLILKMKLQLSVQDWEQTLETINRLNQINADDLDVIKTNIIIRLCRDANYNEALELIRNFIKILDTKEPKNGKLILENVQLFSKICGRNPAILSETFKIVERIVQFNPNNCNYVTELGRQCLLQNQHKEALKYFKTATRINDSSLEALLGVAWCEFYENGVSAVIQKQIDFLLELESAQMSGYLYLLRAKICKNPEEAAIFLKNASDLHILPLKTYPYSDRYLQILNPDFLLTVVGEYFNYIQSNHPGINLKNSQANLVKIVENILKMVTKSCPGLHEALYNLAKLQFLNGELAQSMQHLDQILSRNDDKSSDAYLLMAQVQIQSGLYERAAQNLEICLSNDFNIRNNPIYHYLNGLVDKNVDNYQDSLQSLTTALNLIKNNNNFNLTLTEKASIYIELIDLNNIIGQHDEANRLLEDALQDFHATQEESRILILSAEHAIKRNNIQYAIDLLDKIQKTETYYLQARTKLANILLKHRLDRYAYLQCYKDMVDDNPGSETLILLGDAYMNILEPDDALDCYRKALQYDKNDPYLITKFGKALIDTHYFHKAVQFYKDAIKTIPNYDLKLQLAQLYVQLKEYDKASLLLLSEIDNENNQQLDDLNYLQFKTKLLLLLAEAQVKSSDLKGALTSLKDARDNQNRVKKRLQIEQTTVPDEEIKLLVEICVKLAEISVSLKNDDHAIQFYKDALDTSSNDINIMVALARLYMQMNALEPCQQICANILKIDSENEVASVMMADIAFRKIDFDMAQFHFTQLLVKQPTNWTALVRLIEIMRRTGNINDIPEYLNNAERNCGNSIKSPGLHYCKGLYQLYCGNLNGALRSFNISRQDNEWGKLSLYNMIEICLNPNDEMFNEQFIDGDDTEYRDSRSMALKTADRLLKEYKQRLDQNSDDLLKYRLLVNFRLLATQEKANIERGLEDFITIASQNAYKDHIGPILGISTAHTLLKQTQRAKNQLKRVSKTNWTFDDAEYLERCWLLLSDYYLQSSKYDVALELLNKILHHNKSCYKAYEYLGFIAEKEQRYKEAANHYENAWKFNGKSNPGIGFKLAYNLLKSKNYAEAIDIGQQVLKLSPDYPKIKKDILDKSLNNLRA